jgi:uncharacterized protein (TIGR01777 family)
MKILVSGSHGFIGTALCDYLKSKGHTLLRLIRPNQIAKSDEVFWNPYERFIDQTKLDDLEAVIHLAGENLFGRWSAKKKDAIYQSRVRGTAFLSEKLAAMSNKPRVLICASAIGYYGSREDHECLESAQPGEGFLAEVCKDWEAATEPAVEADIRAVNARFGVVLGKNGGALAKMLTPFKMGMGGPLGDGQQWISWVSLVDTVRAIEFSLAADTLSGPVNVVSPNPVRNKEFAHTLGHVLHRPEVVPVPKRMLHFMFGEMADQTLLASTKALPQKLHRKDFQFTHPDLYTALEAILT